MAAETYTYKAARIAQDVKDKFGDVGSVQINDQMLLRWINDGMRAVVAQNPVIKRVLSGNILAGQALYDFTTVFPSSRVLAYDSMTYRTKPLKIVPFSEFQAYIADRDRLGDSAGEPTIMTMFGDTMTLWPTPSETVANGLTCYLSIYPEDVVNLESVLPLPDRFYNALADYVLAQAFELDENFDAAAQKRQHFDIANQREFGREDRNPTDFYSTITPSVDDGYEY